MISHDKGNFFIGVENVKGNFIFDIASVHEVEYPYRKCEHALFIHIWPHKALVLGKYSAHSGHVTAHLLEALGGKIIDFHKEKKRFSLGQEPVSQGEEQGG